MSFFDFDSMDMCMGHDCRGLCCSTFNPLYTPPRPLTTTTTTTIAAASRPTSRKLLFSEDEDEDDNSCPIQRSNFSSPTCSDDEGDKEDDDELEIEDILLSQQEHKQLNQFDLENAQYHELFNANLEDHKSEILFTPIRAASNKTPPPAVVSVKRAQTPPTMSDNMATFLDTANALRCKLAINNATPTQKQIDSAGLALYEAFGGKRGGGEISEFSKQLLALASLEAKLSTKKKSKKQFEDSLQGSKNYHCQLCNSVDTEFKTREGALLHFRNIHINFKPYYCRHGACEQSFARRTDLRLHLIRKHEEQRPFACKVPMCNKGFASACELRRHVPLEHESLLVAMCSAEPITRAALLSCCHAPSKTRTPPSRKRTSSCPKAPTKQKSRRHRRDDTSSEEEDDFDGTSDEEF